MMKRLLIKLMMITVVLSSGVMAAYNPSASIKDIDYSENLADKRVYNAEINEEIEAYEDTNSVKDYNKQWEKNRAGKKAEAETYFVKAQFMACETPSDYQCPPLKDEFLRAGYRNRLNFIDLKNGKISCSVLKSIDSDQFLTFTSETAIYTATFENKACTEKYSTATNLDTSEKIKKLKKQNDEFIKSIKQQEFKYTVDYKKNGDDEFLDLADILDGIVTFNANIFDFEQTLLTRDLKTRSGYTTLPNDTVIDRFEQQFKTFTEIWNGEGFGSDRFFETIEQQARIRDISAAVANSSYFMLLDFYLKIGDIIVLLSQGLAFLFIVYNGIVTWAMPTLFNKIMKKDESENSPQRGVFGFLALIMLFAGDVQKIDIAYESKSQGIIKTELIVQQTQIQHLMQVLSSETNYWADAIAEIAIKSNMSSLNAATGLLDSNQINALATERLILLKEREALERIETEMCYENYDVGLITSYLQEYRTLTKNEHERIKDNDLVYHTLNTDGISALNANPFPKSEREANMMMYYGNSKRENRSPYNANFLNDPGVVDKEKKAKFRTGYYTPLSLSGCYYNRKKINANDQRLREISNEFNKFENPSQKNAKVEYLRAINETIWSLYARQGYLAISFLPTTNIMIESLNVIDTKNEDYHAAINDLKDQEGVITELATGTLKDIAEDLPVLMIMGRYNIAKIVHPVKEFIVDSIINKIDTASSFLGPLGKSVTWIAVKYYDIKDKVTINEDIDLIDLKITAFLIKNTLEAVIVVTLVAGSILLFTLLFIEKLFAFLSSMFLLIYAFAKNQEDRISIAIAKIFAVYFKTLLIVLCIFLSIYSLDLVTSLELIFVESFFKSMDMLENATWSYRLEQLDFENISSLLIFFFKKYIFFGVTKFAFIVLKLVLVVQMIWKMPSFMYELIYEKVHSVADSVGETLMNANDKQTIRI